MTDKVTPFASLLRGVVAAFLIAGTVAVTAYGIYTWNQERQDVEENLTILSSYLATASQAFFENLGNALIPLGEYISDKDVTNSSEQIRDQLTRFQSRYPEIGAMAIFSPQGQMLINTANPNPQALPDFRNDQAYLKEFMAVLQSPALYVIGPPEYGKVIKQWRFPFRHVVRNAQGQPVYLIQAAIPLESNNSFLQHLPVPPDSFIGLLREDGLQQARWPAPDPTKIYGRLSEGPVAKKVRSNPSIRDGVFTGISPWRASDGERIGAFQHLAKLPFYAYVSSPSDYLWARWWRRNVPVLASFIVFMGIFYFITYRVTVRERSHNLELIKQARHDALTGLPNRQAVDEILSAEVNLISLTGQNFSVLFLDLDRFKDINDSLGHAVGDQLLIVVANAIKNTLRNVDVISRFAGDEFLIILPGINRASAINTCERLLTLFNRPIQVGEHSLSVTASMGVAIFPEHASDPGTLIKFADTAMYEAKRQGRNAYVIYQSNIGEKIRQRITLEHQLRDAINKEQFRLVYQPIVEFSSGRIIGVEALVRWQDDDGKLRSPGEFIQVAEESGLILPLGEWVLHTACAQSKAWNDAGHDIWVAVNLSTRQFQDPNLVSKVIEVLRKTGLEPGQLELEITESAAMLDPQASIGILGRLKMMGVQIAIDDFGSGYSSLSYLKRIPAHKIKIDKSFVDGVTNDPDDIAIVRTIIALAATLEMDTVAEGIETAEQFRVIEQFGCKQAQGYWISRPGTVDSIEAFFQSHKARHKA